MMKIKAHPRTDIESNGDLKINVRNIISFDNKNIENILIKDLLSYSMASS